MNKDTLSVEEQQLKKFRDGFKKNRFHMRGYADERLLEAFLKESIALAQQETIQEQQANCEALVATKQLRLKKHLIQGVKEFYGYLNHQIRMIESHPQDFSEDEFIGMQNVRERFEEIFDSELSSLKEIKEVSK